MVFLPPASLQMRLLFSSLSPPTMLALSPEIAASLPFYFRNLLIASISYKKVKGGMSLHSQTSM